MKREKMSASAENVVFCRKCHLPMKRGTNYGVGDPITSSWEIIRARTFNQPAGGWYMFDTVSLFH